MFMNVAPGALQDLEWGTDLPQQDLTREFLFCYEVSGKGWIFSGV